MTATQQANVEIVRRALEWDPDVLAEDMVWHFQSPYRDFVAHFEGKHTAMNDWITMRDDATGGTFRQRPVEFWSLAEDLVAVHVDVEMSIGGVRHSGSSVVVYRLADGLVVEGFDIPSRSLFE
jgi:uncharacterized protein